MTTSDTAATDQGGTGALLVRLEGFEGPLDLLLELARGQKVDLAQISILALVEQYLAVIEGAARIRLELAADWLVMAAWLAWLKSRLLLPKGTAPDEDAEGAAEVLTARLAALQQMRAAALWLAARPVLGQDVFARGLPEDFTMTDRSRLAVDLPGLMRGYLAALRRAAGQRSYRPAPPALWSVQDALARLVALVGQLPDWSTLEQFLPPHLASPLQRRAAVASTLLASLEMARGGGMRLRQEWAFGPIHLRHGTPEEGDDA